MIKIRDELREEAAAVAAGREPFSRPVFREKPVFDASLFPRVYQMTPLQRLLRYGQQFMMGAVAVYFGWRSVHGKAESQSDHLFGGAVALLLVVWIAFDCLQLARFRLTLYPDTIALRTRFGSRQMNRSDVARAYVKYLRARRGGHIRNALVLVPRQTGASELTVPLYFDWDAAFEAWMSDIPVTADKG